MALLISHRGNTQGIDESRENTQEYIQSALDDKYHVVVDVFLIGNAHLALGIDSPTHPTNLEFLQQPLVIARAHSIACLDFLLSNQVHCFLHTNDTSLTSGGLIWTSHTSHLTSRCIYAMPEWTHSRNHKIQRYSMCRNMLKFYTRPPERPSIRYRFNRKIGFGRYSYSEKMEKIYFR